MKKSKLIFVVVLLLVSFVGAWFGGYTLGSGAYSETSSSEKGFSSAEKCIKNYFEALAEGDFEKAMASYAIKSSAKGFDYYQISKHMNFMLFTNTEMPATSDLFVHINEATLESAYAKQMKYFIYSLMSDYEISTNYQFQETREIKNFIRDIDVERLEDLEVIDIYQYTRDDERILDRFNEMAELYGHENMSEYIISFSFENEEYYLVMTLYEDDHRFTIQSNNASFSGTNVLGTALLQKDNMDLINSEDYTKLK